MRETRSTDGNRWQWLKRGELKRETESLLCQLKNRLCELMPSNTQFIRQAILHYEDSVMKRQSITHIVSACSILAKSQYRKRHDKVGTYVHWLLCKKHHLQCSDKWHVHTHTHTRTPQSVQENNEYKILCDFNIQSHRVQVTRHLFVSTSKRECQIIAFAIPGDQNIAIK